MESPSINWQERARRAEAINEQSADALRHFLDEFGLRCDCDDDECGRCFAARALDAWAQHVADYQTLEDAQK